MRFKKVFIKFALTAVILLSLNFRFVSVTAQDIVTSDDISNGASVFVFRESKKKSQIKLSSRKTFVSVRSNKNSPQQTEKFTTCIRQKKKNFAGKFAQHGCEKNAGKENRNTVKSLFPTL